MRKIRCEVEEGLVPFEKVARVRRTDGALEEVKQYASFPVKNRRGEQVGEIRAAFELR